MCPDGYTIRHQASYIYTHHTYIYTGKSQDTWNYSERVFHNTNVTEIGKISRFVFGEKCKSLCENFFYFVLLFMLCKNKEFLYFTSSVSFLFCSPFSCVLRSNAVGWKSLHPRLVAGIKKKTARIMNAVKIAN